MHIGKIEVKRRVWVCLLFAVAVTGMWWIWDRSKIPPVAMKPELKQPVVRLANAGAGAGDEIMRERVKYLDPAPLFFPTEWNFAQGALREGLKRQPGQVFPGFEAQLVFGEQTINLHNSESTRVSGGLADVIGPGNESPFGGMGEVDIKPMILPERSGYLEVRRLSDGKTIVAQTLIGISISQADFAPLEFLVAISPAGLVGEPVLMNGSGLDEVDASLRTYLTKTFHLGERLSPGTYRVVIGP